MALLSGCHEDASKRIKTLYGYARSPDAHGKERIQASARDEDRNVRATAIVVMAEVDPDEARKMARAALDDRDGVVRAAAVRILAGEVDPELTLRLAALAVDDPVDQVRSACLVAIAGAEGETVRAAFERGLADPALHVRRAALEAGGRRPGLLPTDKVAQSLATETDWENRVLAARILGASGDPAAYAPLDEASLDPHEFVRAAAVREVGSLVRSGVSRPPPPSPSPAPVEKTNRPPGV